MITACRENSVKLMVAFMKRFNPSFRQVKALLEEGQLGQVFEGKFFGVNEKNRGSYLFWGIKLEMSWQETGGMILY